MKSTHPPFAMDSDVSLPGIKLYKRRWFMLALFACYSATNAFQWIHYSIISNIITRFYGVEQTTTDWLSMVFMLAYIPLIIPATWLLDKRGVRTIAILGSSLNALGACVKIGSAEPNLFAVTMTGQVIAAIAQVFILGMPSKIAATWFGPKEVSTACAIAVFGNQAGIAIGFLAPPIIVPDVNDESIVGPALRYMFIGTAAVTTTLAILVIIFFQAKPPLPPSRAQLTFLQNQEEEMMSYKDSIKFLVTKLPVVLLILSYGINTGSFYAISTLLNQEILTYYPDNIKEVGEIGLTMVLAGIGGAILCGIILDRTRTYKLTTVLVYVMTTVFMVTYTCTLSVGMLWIVYVTGGALGFFMTGYLPIGYEFAAEITHPVSEGTSSGLLTASAQVFGIVFTIAMGNIFPTGGGILAANISLSVMLGIGTILTVLIRPELRRQEANAIDATSTENSEEEKYGTKI